MKKKIADIWIKALRSGEFKQGIQVLEKQNKYCCLGVLCTLALNEGVCDYGVACGDTGAYDDYSFILPSSVMKWAGLRSDSGELPSSPSLVSLNDRGVSFEKIASVIEKNWRCL